MLARGHLVFKIRKALWSFKVNPVTLKGIKNEAEHIKICK